MLPEPPPRSPHDFFLPVPAPSSQSPPPAPQQMLASPLAPPALSSQGGHSTHARSAGPSRVRC